MQPLYPSLCSQPGVGNGSEPIRIDHMLVELQLLEKNRPAYDQMRALQQELEQTHPVHLVDAGYPKHLGNSANEHGSAYPKKRRVFPTSSPRQRTRRTKCGQWRTLRRCGERSFSEKK